METTGMFGQYGNYRYVWTMLKLQVCFDNVETTGMFGKC